MRKPPSRTWGQLFGSLAAHDRSWERGQYLPQSPRSRQLAQLDWTYEPPHNLRVTANTLADALMVTNAEGESVLSFKPAGLKRVRAFLVSPGGRTMVCLGERHDGQNFAVCLYCLQSGRMIRELGRARTKRLELSANGRFLRFDSRCGPRVLRFSPAPQPVTTASAPRAAHTALGHLPEMPRLVPCF